MTKEFEIYGCIETPADVDTDRITEEFIRWIESKGWFFGGGFRELKDETKSGEAPQKA